MNSIIYNTGTIASIQPCKPENRVRDSTKVPLTENIVYRITTDYLVKSILLITGRIGHNTSVNWVDIIVIILLILSFLGGMKEGAVKTASSLVAMLIAIPLAGLSYRLIASLLSFLPGDNWENFLGFFITMGIITVILHLIFLLPGKIIGAIWKKGVFFRVLGGALNLIGTMIGMAVFTLIVQAYPIFDWLERWVSSSSVLSALVDAFGFIQIMLPAAFKGTLL
jgi:uncharacterized membrane protein required for colicin V production